MHPSGRREITETIEMAAMRLEFEEATPRFRLATAVAEFAEILRHSYWARGSEIADLLPMVQQLARELKDDAQADDFACLIEQAVELSESVQPMETP
jgi:Ca-activated chloride channel family protein